jgi:outer membrane protein assembly factor BamB
MWIGGLLGAVPACGDDWPMWRYDAQRTAAAAANGLPGQLQPIWTRQLPARQPVWDDPLNRDLMPYDRVFEPIVMDGRLLVGFNDTDKLVAMDAATGTTLWSFYTEAPVRLPPAGSQGRVFFCSDDGFLYCLDAATGKLCWKYGGAPGGQLAIGNRRLISTWPARGGPVVREGTVYFAASIWPFMGTFIHALDAETGQLRWVNDSTGAQYIKQPHSAPSFAGVAPQGALVATASLLLVPGGRSVPAVLDRADGTLRYFEINAGGKGSGGSFVAADEKHFYVHTRYKATRAFRLDDGIKTAFMPGEPVLHEGMVYSAEADGDRPRLRAYRTDQSLVWEIEADGSGDLILAGRQLIAAGSTEITRIDLPLDGQPPRIAQRIPVAGRVERLIAADEKLFAVTLDGRIIAYGEANRQTAEITAVGPLDPPDESLVVSDQARQAAANLLAAGDAQGYALWFGDADSSLAQAIVTQSPFVELAIVDHDAAVVDRMRRQLDQQGRYGAITVHQAAVPEFLAPKYVANMLFVDLATELDESLIARLYESVRPYGGVMYLLASVDREGLARRAEALRLEQAQVEIADHGVIIRRQGALPGSADWTHQYGDIANTLKSNDRRVKLPLGVLWFGGSSNLDVLPRHGHGPPEQVVGGRLFIQGINSLSARDVYTGRVLWKREFDNLGTFDVYYDETYKDSPLDTKYNQVHIPGANARGTNYVVTEDRVYMVEGSVCHVLDPASGATLADISLPSAAGDSPWGYLGVYKDVLIGGIGLANYRDRQGVTLQSEGLLKNLLKKSRDAFGAKNLDDAASSGLVGFDRYSGEVLWQLDARHSFWHNGVVAGGEQIYCLDKFPLQVEQALLRRGQPRPDSYRIVALDYRSGEVQWEIQDSIFGTWLAYSEAHDLLLQAGAAASDRLPAEAAAGMAVYSAADGSCRWSNPTLRYSGPCILHNDLIITNTNAYAESAGAFYLRDGSPKLVPNPITGKPQPWKLTRAYGCNHVIASEHLLTFRSGAAGYYDLLSDAGTGNLGGFKSGCTSNLVVAGGVLNAPDYTRTCSCTYQNQTSLALVHMPEVEMWGVHLAAVDSHGEQIETIGINFAAPGDRRDAEGLLWFEYPVAAGPSPPLSITWNDGARPIRHHASSFADHDLSWILASGIENLTELRIRLQLQDPSDVSEEAAEVHADDDDDGDGDGDGAQPPGAAVGETGPPQRYRLRLLFGSPKPEGPEEPVLDVDVQGNRILTDVRLSSTSGRGKFAMASIEDIEITDELHLRFVPKQGKALLSGLQLTRQRPGESQ